MPRGRPSKYDPKYCDLLIEHARNGGSWESFAAVVGVLPETLSEWFKNHKDFSVAKRMALACSLWELEKIGWKAMRGEIDGFNATAWVFTLKNRHGWRDKVEITDAEIEETSFEAGN